MHGRDLTGVLESGRDGAKIPRGLPRRGDRSAHGIQIARRLPTFNPTDYCPG